LAAGDKLIAYVVGVTGVVNMHEIADTFALSSIRLCTADVFRVIWDGKDRQLNMASTPTTVISMLNRWPGYPFPATLSAISARRYYLRGARHAPAPILEFASA
jgi:hypothetical protein